MAQAHPGRLDSNGGHWNKKTEQYECHKDYCIPKAERKISDTIKSPELNKIQTLKIEEKGEVSEAISGLVIVPDSAIPDKNDIPKYNRKTWKHWIDLDGDCQDTRAEALIIAAKGNVKFKDSKNCEVVSGNFYGQYTNTYMKRDGDLDVDHIVPLNEAHLTGGYKWSKALKMQFANDPLNIIAVNKGENRSKSDKYPGKWMPPYKAYHCEYLERWIGVKKKYSLQIRQSTIDMSIISCKGKK